LPTSRERAFCSGAGGVYGKAFPEGAREVARRRLGEFEETGAERLATACPSAARHLAREPGAQVVDLISVLYEAMRLDPPT
jgi:Fe-S oxidoreductase